MKKAAIYVRVSTLEQKKHGLSVDSQIKALEDYCINHGMEVQGIYNDAGISARKTYKKRPALLKMIDCCQNGEIDILLFTRLDRFFRSVPDYYSCITQMNGVPWRAIWEDYETETSAGQFKVNIMLSIAQAEADRTSERIRAVNRYKKETGKRTSGKCAIGYKIDGDKIVKDPATKDSVEALFSTFLETSNTSEAIRKANAKGLSLTREHGYKMLKNPTYLGFVLNQEAEPYITKEQRELILKRIEGRKTKNKTATHSPFIYSGLLKCKICGSTLCGKNSKRKWGSYNIYVCHNSGIHKYIGVYERVLENYVTTELDKILKDLKAEADIEIIEVENTNEQIKALKQKLERVGIRFEEGDFTLDQYRMRKNEVLAEIELLEEKRAKDTKDIPVLPDGWQQIYNDLDGIAKRGFLCKIIDRITIGPQREFSVFFL